MDDVLTNHARTLRRNMTDAERLLWRHLRNRRMFGYKFRRQVIMGPYIVDFACIEARLVVEADGGQHVEQRGYDEKRSQWLKARGYRVLRFWNNEILGSLPEVLETIASTLNRHDF